MRQLLLLACFYPCLHLAAMPYETMLKKHNEFPVSSIPGIDATYVINLDMRPERWHRLEPMLYYHGIDAARFSAVFGLEFTIEDARTYCTSCMKVGQVACMFSHLSIYQDALDRDLDVIWVLEDDVEIRRDPFVLSKLIEELNEIDPKWDVLYTSTDCLKANGRPLCSRAIPRHRHELNPLSYYLYRKQVSRNLQLLRIRFGTESMILSKRGARKILHHFLTSDLISFPFDWELHYTPGLRQYGVRDPVVCNAYFRFNYSDTSQTDAPNFYEISERSRDHILTRQVEHSR